MAHTKEDAITMFESISEQDPDHLLKWEIDFPENSSDFVPFLGTAIRIEDDGEISHKYYRKSQKKNITLHFNSHHSLKTKVEVVKNFYITADKSSSPLNSLKSRSASSIIFCGAMAQAIRIPDPLKTLISGHLKL